MQQLLGMKSRLSHCKITLCSEEIAPCSERSVMKKGIFLLGKISSEERERYKVARKLTRVKRQLLYCE
jgi:hypothetical protein